MALCAFIVVKQGMLIWMWIGKLVTGKEQLRNQILTHFTDSPGIWFSLAQTELAQIVRLSLMQYFFLSCSFLCF